MNEYRRVADAPSAPSSDADKDDVLAYLAAGEVVQAARGRGDDRIDPARRRAVPLTVLTDGTWVWTGATRYYLAQHDVWPEPDFVAHVRARAGRPVEVSSEVVDDVTNWLQP